MEKYSAHAKCIIAGEHAVLRGHPAIVFPLSQFQLILTYQPSEKNLSAEASGELSETLLLMFWGTLKKAFELVSIPLNNIKGEIHIENHIPLCAGLGFSAALCLAIGKWFVAQKWLNTHKLLDFTRQLEDKFHQESSGVDIAGVMSNSAIYYVRNKEPQTINPKWTPKFYLSYCNHLSVTAEAVAAVKLLFDIEKFKAKRIDIDMAESVTMIQEALLSPESKGFQLLSEGIKQSYHCFEQWNLITNKLQEHIDFLMQHGAIACKPTGAGYGGYVLSLWQDEPQESFNFEMYPVFPTI